MTVRLTCGDPDDFTVTIADLEVVPVLAAADNTIVPLLVPEAGEMVTHGWFDDADHEVFDDTDTDIDPPDAEGPHEDMANSKLGVMAPGGGVTVTMYAPVPEEFARTWRKYVCPAVSVADTLNCLSAAPSLLYVTIVVPFERYKVPYGSPNDEDAGLDEVNTHVPVTVGTILNQSLSPSASIAPVTGEPKSDQVQYDEVDDPQSSTTPGWVTVTVRDTLGEPDVVFTVTVADREAVVVLAAADNVTDPSPEPVAGLTFNHDALVDTDADHAAFDDTATDDEPAAADGTAHDDTPNTRVGAGAPGWVTVTVRDTLGEPDEVFTVTVADREDEPVFAAADNVTDPSFEPVDGLAVNHDAPDDTDTDHDAFDETCTDDEPANDEGTDHDDTPKTNSLTTGAVAVTM